MTKVVVDDALAKQFVEPQSCVELCDKSGKVLGHCYPVVDEDDALYAQFKCPFSEEELQRRESAPGGSSLAEFWQRMGPK
jgi:hypothetical protein